MCTCLRIRARTISDAVIRNLVKTICPVVAAALLLSGCVNNFSKFYQDRSGVFLANPSSHLEPYSGTTQIFTTNDPVRDMGDLRRRGYVLLGESSFVATQAVTMDQLKAQAKDVGADIVLYRTEYEGSVEAAMPLIHYQPGQTSTTYSSGTTNASIYGTGGTAYGTGNYSGTSTTTTPGTYSTTMVPVTLQRNSHDALFWRKGKPSVLGVRWTNLTEEMRLQLKRNTGVVVQGVIDDSPAFRANILPGDIIIGIDDVSADSVTDVVPKITARAGKECKLTLLRGGAEVVVTVKLNPVSS